MSAFWDVFIGIVTVCSILGTLLLLISNAQGTPGTSTDHVWDDDLRELNNPLPRWWLVMFVLTIVFAVGYLQLYPGMGSFEGSLRWSQSQQLRDDLAGVKQQHDRVFARFADRDATALAGDPEALAAGHQVFSNTCGACHGQDARGALGFPDLTDGDWLYGGSAQAIEASITGGRNGQMPAFGKMLDAARIALLAETVEHWSDAGWPRHAEGQVAFAETCGACHGADARGNPGVGAPNLTDAIWLHGGDDAQVQRTIREGRTSKMPAHNELLGATEIKLVTAYVLSLSVRP
jgi:cytochrome c oxidase cbb3-type subunit 3